MPRLRLTEIVVRGLRGSDQYVTYFDTNLPGFGIRVGKRSKTFVVVRGRKRERISIGRYPNLSLADARTKARRLLANEPEPMRPSGSSASIALLAPLALTSRFSES